MRYFEDLKNRFIVDKSVTLWKKMELKSYESRKLDEKLLIEATEKGDYNQVKRLLEDGVSVNATRYNRDLFYAYKNYVTPLRVAAEGGFSDCVAILIKYGANVNETDCFGFTALHMAAEKGHLECLKFLLEASAESSLPSKSPMFGSDITFLHPGGTTPLHLAAFNNHIDCISELINYRADYNAIDEHGRTSLYIAAESGHSDCVLAHLKNVDREDILSLPSFKTSDTPLHFAVTHRLIECVKELLKRGSDVSHLNSERNSPLHLALTPVNNDGESNSFDLLKMLILDGYNVNVNQENRSKMTPLHFAVYRHRRPEMAMVLIAYGANVNIRNGGGFTPLEQELNCAFSDFEILKYIVRSMLHLPSLEKLGISNPMPYPRKSPLMPRHPTEVHIRILSLESVVDIASAISEVLQTTNIDSVAEKGVTCQYCLFNSKLVWYKSLSSNPRTLQHYCRFSIRRALGSRFMRCIHQLPLPNKLKSYLLLEMGD